LEKEITGHCSTSQSQRGRKSGIQGHCGFILQNRKIITMNTANKLATEITLPVRHGVHADTISQHDAIYDAHGFKLAVFCNLSLGDDGNRENAERFVEALNSHASLMAVYEAAKELWKELPSGHGAKLGNLIKAYEQSQSRKEGE
jgi:hypothetical protein